jgi:universal stress protein A
MVMFLPKKILVPTDFSETAGNALAHAKALAGALGCELHILHVLTDPMIYAPAMVGVESLPRLREDMERDARETLDKVLSERERQRFDARLVLRWGTPHLEIADYAAKQESDLIVMGTHGRSPLPSLLLGSVAQKVLHEAPCPVLAVRPPSAPAGSPTRR